MCAHIYIYISCTSPEIEMRMYIAKKSFYSDRSNVLFLFKFRVERFEKLITHEMEQHWFQVVRKTNLHVILTSGRLFHWYFFSAFLNFSTHKNKSKHTIKAIFSLCYRLCKFQYHLFTVQPPHTHTIECSVMMKIKCNRVPHNSLYENNWNIISKSLAFISTKCDNYTYFFCFVGEIGWKQQKNRSNAMLIVFKAHNNAELSLGCRELCHHLFINIVSFYFLHCVFHTHTHTHKYMFILLYTIRMPCLQTFLRAEYNLMQILNSILRLSRKNDETLVHSFMFSLHISANEYIYIYGVSVDVEPHEHR